MLIVSSFFLFCFTYILIDYIVSCHLLSILFLRTCAGGFFLLSNGGGEVNVPAVLEHLSYPLPGAARVADPSSESEELVDPVAGMPTWPAIKGVSLLPYFSRVKGEKN